MQIADFVVSAQPNRFRPVLSKVEGLRIGFHPASPSSAIPQYKAETDVTLLPALLALAGVLLRLAPWLARYPLHRDEALYGAWARLIASGTDPFLLTAWIDKPPLAIYALAGGLKAFGISELALRLPGMLASALTIPLTYGLARRAYGSQTALLAGLLVAMAPFAILFAPTAFTDPWLTLWMVAATWAALAGRPFWAGLALGLAVASKQQGVLVAPLVIALLAVGRGQGAGVRRQGSGVRRQEAGDRRQESGVSHQPSAISHRLSAISHRLSAIGHQPSAISHQPSAISHQPSAISHQPSAICHQPSAIGYQPSAIGYLPPTIRNRKSQIANSS